LLLRRCASLNLLGQFLQPPLRDILLQFRVQLGELLAKVSLQLVEDIQLGVN